VVALLMASSPPVFYAPGTWHSPRRLWTLLRLAHLCAGLSFKLARNFTWLCVATDSEFAEDQRVIRQDLKATAGGRKQSE
jgi:hypothetical protein